MAELKTEQTGQEDELPPLSPAAIAAREKVRAMVKEMEEAERTRRISEEKTEPDKNALEKLITVQEDLIRSINLRKVSIYIYLSMHNFEMIGLNQKKTFVILMYNIISVSVSYVPIVYRAIVFVVMINAIVQINV